MQILFQVLQALLLGICPTVKTFQCASFFLQHLYKMPPLKNPIELLELAIDNLHHLVREEILRVTQVLEEVEDGQELLEYTENYLSQQISTFKNHIFSHIPFHLIDHILGNYVIKISKGFEQ